MTKTFATAVAIAAVLAGAPALACSKPNGAAAIDAGIMEWINAERAKKGLTRLKASGKLDGAAQAHACDMAERGYFSHTGPGGKTFQNRIKSVGYRMRTAVENIGKSPRASTETAAGIWRDSAQHWDNILNPAIRDIGVGVATDGTNVYYVFIGGAPR